LPAGAGLLGALIFFCRDTTGVETKGEMQEVLGAGTWRGSFTQDQILNYCASDVAAAERLFLTMAHHIDLPRAIYRGRYMGAVSAMEATGVPIDYATLQLLRANWRTMQDKLIAEVDRDFNVYDGSSFKTDKFLDLLIRTNTPWAFHHPSGRPDLSDEFFKEQVRIFPWLSPLRELRTTLSDLRLESLAVSKIDHRNRTLLSPFYTRTGRNQPKPHKFVFGPATWIRGLIKPPKNTGIAYLDWSGQEIAIAAALSGDKVLREAYCSGDPYIYFGRSAGFLPPDATKQSHPAERELCKVIFLATGYGQGEFGLAQRIGKPRIVARELLAAHRRTFKRFWEWSDAAVDHALLRNQLSTVFGWRLQLDSWFDDNGVERKPNSRSLRNFYAQAHGAELMRLAACLGVERGVQVAAPIHDAFLICAPLNKLDDDIATMSNAMREAAKVVLGGFEVDVEVKKVIWPNRYADPRGRVMWEKIMMLLKQSKSKRAAA
jgi:DNA polymerase-1